MSAAENLAFGAAYPPAAMRRESLRRCCRALRDLAIPTWVGLGAGSPATRAVAVEERVAVNLWDAPIEAVASETEVEVTWGGPLPDDVRSLGQRLKALAGAGATWAVCAWPRSVEAVAEAAAAVRVP
jgi:hypothetical protein